MKNYQNKVFTSLAVSLIFQTLAAHAALPDGYEDLTAADKRGILWDNISSDFYSLNSMPDAKTTGVADVGVLGLPHKLTATFNYSSDEMPHKRSRAIHKSGTAALVKWTPSTQTEYTGIFQSGGIGIIRASLANETPYTPGFGLKMLVDGKPSVNFVAMYSLDGQGANQDFFANTFSTIVADPKTSGPKALEIPFTMAIRCPFMKNGPDTAGIMANDEGAFVNNKGIETPNFKSPYEVSFTPADDVKGVVSEVDHSDVRVALGNNMAFHQGVTLYHIAGRDKNSVQWVDLGTLELESDFVASPYVDDTLFFKHQKHIAIK